LRVRIQTSTDRQSGSRAGKGRSSCSFELQAHASTWHVTKNRIDVMVNGIKKSSTFITIIYCF